MNFIDLPRKRDGAFMGLWRTRRGVLLASAGVLLVGTLAAMSVAVVQRAAPPVLVVNAAPEALTLALPRPARAEPDSAALLLAAVAALRPDPVVVRIEPIPFAAPLPESAPRIAVAPARMDAVMSTKAGHDVIVPQPPLEIVTALPLPDADLFLRNATTVAVLAPDAATPRPVRRPASVVAIAQASAPARPQRRPVVLASAEAPQRPLPRPGAAALAPTLVSFAPQPRPALLVQAASQPAAQPVPLVEAVVIEAAVAEAMVASAAPAVSPQPRSRPARVLLAAASARHAATVAEPAAPQRVALRDPVAAPPSGNLAEAIARAPQAANCPTQLARGIPRRSGSAASGSQFGAALGNASGTERDQMVVREVLSGNVPQFLRALTPVTLTGTGTSGKTVAITVCVTPDYVAVGDNDDFLRVPMGLPEAAQIADRLGFMLPTTRIVDAIYSQAGVRLAPRPMQAGPQMSSTSYLRQHNATIEGQTNAAGLRNGTLVAGIKKDLVLTNALRRARGQVAIYGWHQPNGRPIQPLTTVHGQHYSDYSHGVRLVSQTAYLNGRAVPLADLLEDRDYAQIISSEGPIAAPRTLLASLYTR
ncbi:MAG: hypothetical protein K0B00_07410 [Rhodobacteraceae bacterium]|nr:hypothetical protein [Paracoccaceae bacterium]